MGFENGAVAGESFHAKELRKWNTPRSQGGMRADAFQMFPLMLYKARKKLTGGPFVCVDPFDEQFTSQNQLTVGNEDELRRAEREGWKRSPAEAVDHARGLEDEISNAAAFRAAEDKRMSEKARAEAAKADAESFEHLPEIPQKPTVKPKRVLSPEAKAKLADSLAKAREAKKNKAAPAA